MPIIGIIGGSGLDDPDILDDPRDIEVDTPYGPPSSPIKAGRVNGREVRILARHGREHAIPPSFVNYRANIQALKDAGCDGVLATTAVGSLRREIDRGHLVVLDQFIDFTRQRKTTFHETFDPHAPVHTPMADPFDHDLRRLLVNACQDLLVAHHERGTVVTIEGPRFSARAESNMFRGFGADVVNMSTAPECILANEAGLPYAAVAMSTDYDCWKQDEEPVTWDEILRIFQENAQKVTSVLVETITKALPDEG
ncbi:MAG: S-methyl-5'-thioadenosine phosphorylase [Desulfovibrionaceae bacterium]